MATTLKLNKRPPAEADKTGRAPAKPARPPVRGAGSGVRHRPTLAEAQAQRAERETQWQQRQQQERDEGRPNPRRSAQDDRPPARPAKRPPGPGAGGGRSDEHRGRRDEGGRPPAPRAKGPGRPGERHAEDARPAPPRQGQRASPHPAPAFDPAPRGETPARRAPNTAFGRNEPKAAFEPAIAGKARAAHGQVADGGRGPAPAQRGAPGDARPLPSRDRHAGPTGPAPRQPRHRADPPAMRHAEGQADRSGEKPASMRRPAGEQQPPGHAPGSMRLSKRMSELGLASRREADEWIDKGWVRVDGEVVRELGSRVLPSQAVTIDSPARQQQAKQVTVLLNKPIGFVSGQAEDGYEPAFVLVTPQTQWQEDGSGLRWHRDHLRSLVPAGRLDIDSTGLLVLTQDGRVAKTLIGEDSPVDKEYLVRVQSLDGDTPPRQSLSPRQLAQLNHGLELDGQALRPAKVEWVNEDQLRFVLVEGKKRQIRRMCEAVGLKVTGLKRVRIGHVMLGDLPVGQWRYLRADEAF